MVNLEKLFNSAFCAIRHNPRLMLPFTLTWLPASLISLTVALIIRNFVESYTYNTIIAGFEVDPYGMMKEMLISNASLVVFIFAVYTVSIIISSYVSAIYPRISWQIYNKRELSIKDAAGHANKRYLSVLWTSVLFDTLIIMAIGLLFIIFSLVITATQASGIGMAITIIAGFIIAGIGIIALIIFGLPADLFLAPVVVIEELSGLKAIRKSFSTLKGHMFEIWLYIILLMIANSIFLAVAGAFANIAVMAMGSYSTIITTILLLFPSTFILLAYGLLYLEVTTRTTDENDQGPTC